MHCITVIMCYYNILLLLIISTKKNVYRVIHIGAFIWHDWLITESKKKIIFQNCFRNIQKVTESTHSFQVACWAYNTNHIMALLTTNAGRIRNTYLSIYRTISTRSPWTITERGRSIIRCICRFQNSELIWIICCWEIYGWDDWNDYDFVV